MPRICVADACAGSSDRPGFVQSHTCMGLPGTPRSPKRAVYSLLAVSAFITPDQSLPTGAELHSVPTGSRAMRCR
ncbi:MAG TPA: hypothetical protein VFE05_12605 [Longimicrobiaceae bacterium]|jgi:hypothetical protein|nr:hypothetical protein [Longimicrobiaceae bacterium]